MKLGEWVREVLLERMEGCKPMVIEETVLAETLALRTILLNAFYKLAPGEKLAAGGVEGQGGDGLAAEDSRYQIGQHLARSHFEEDAGAIGVQPADLLLEQYRLAEVACKQAPEGGRIAGTRKPCSSRRCERTTALRASPTISGTIWQLDGPMVKPSPRSS